MKARISRRSQVPRLKHSLPTPAPKDWKVDATTNPLDEDLVESVNAGPVESPFADEPILFVRDDVKKAMGVMSDSLKSHIANMEEEVRRNPRWPGALGDLPGCVKSDELSWDTMLGDGEKLLTTENDSAWLVTMRPNFMRFGAAGVPTPGMACVLTSVNKLCYVHAYPVSVLVERGIDSESIQAWQDGTSADKVRDEETWLFRLEPGALGRASRLRQRVCSCAIHCSNMFTRCSCSDSF